MVDLQTIGVLITAVSVTVAAIYYTITLRITQRNTKIQLSTRIAEKLTTKEFLGDGLDMQNLDWTTVEDFKKRYDHTVNRESFKQRFSIWLTFDNLGYQIREGLVDPYIVYDAAGWFCVMTWGRYEPIINGVSRPELGSRAWENFEYLARIMWRIAKERGAVSPDGKGNTNFDLYWGVFEST